MSNMNSHNDETHGKEHGEVNSSHAAFETYFEPTFLHLFQWKSFFIFCSILIIAFIYTISTSDLFQVPKDTQQAYLSFQKAKQQYENNPLYWDLKQRNLIDEIQQDTKTAGGRHLALLLQDSTGEMVISFLTKELGLPIERLDLVAFNMKASSTNLSFLISKIDQGWWPLKIILSLEIEVTLENGNINLLFSRLRRGSQDLATGLTWAYFGSDLEWLRHKGVVVMKASQGNVF